jgi:hypothetical protein
MELKNINDRPNLVILEGDEKNFAYMEKNDKRVYIGHPKYSDFHEETFYPIYVDGNDIYGTGTNTLGQAITWCETYLKFQGDPGFIEGFIEDIDAIDRKTSFMRQVLLKVQHMADEKKEGN